MIGIDPQSRIFNVDFLLEIEFGLTQATQRRLGLVNE